MRGNFSIVANNGWIMDGIDNGWNSFTARVPEVR
jgi:hypothetical protein